MRASTPAGARGKARERGRYKPSEEQRSVNETLVAVVAKSRDARHKWLPRYEQELGIRPIIHDGGKVTEARCKFCEAFGREKVAEDPTHLTALTILMSAQKKKKRAKTSKLKVFKTFRRDHITKHMTLEHPTKWGAFQDIAKTDADIKAFFRRPETIIPFLPTQPGFDFGVPNGIVRLIRRLLCNSEDSEDDIVAVDADIGDVSISDDFIETEGEHCLIHIKNRDQFEMVVKCLNLGISFRSITILFVTFGEGLSNMKLGSPNEKAIGRYVRFVVSLNLSAIRLCLQNVWGFSIMADGATHRAEGYLDMRVAFALQGKVHNFHLLAIPMGRQSHTGANYAHLVLKVLEDLGDCVLIQRLIGISTDGAATMLGRHQGFATRVREAARAAGNEAVTVNWCGSHQLNLAVAAFLKILDNHFNFRSRLSAEISFTRKFESVRFAIGLCPTYTTTRWESIYDTCHFLAKHYSSLVELQEEKNYAKSSYPWWLTLFVVTDISELIRVCFRRMQFVTVTMTEQYAALDELVRALQLKYESDSSDGSPKVDLDKVAHHLKWSSFQSMNLFDSIPESAMNADIGTDPNFGEIVAEYEEEYENESFELQEYNEPPAQNALAMTRQDAVKAMSAAITVLLQRVSKIRLDVCNDVRVEPPTRPAEVLTCENSVFRALLKAHAAKLIAQYGNTANEDIWEQRKQMIRDYEKKSDFRRCVDNQSDLTLEESWRKANIEGSFNLLSKFALGLASIAPGTHTVEGDFSTLKRTKGPHRGRLSNYALEGELQAQQYFALMELASTANAK